MVTYIVMPIYQTTIGGVVTDNPLTAQINLRESDLWDASFTFEANSTFLANIDNNDTFLLEVKEAGGAFSTIFSGSVFLTDQLSDESGLKVGVQCVGEGHALSMMNVAEEYGTQSRNPARDTISGILTNADVGIIPKWVNKYAGGTNDSGYSIDTTYVESLIGTVPFISFPWKPADKCLNDLCDLNTALNSGSRAGPHWIVDHSGYLRLKRIGATQTGWTKYYGNSAANAKLTEAVDFLDWNPQAAVKEANVILYYGLWRRPSSGDAWTEDTADDWTPDDAVNDAITDSTTHMIGSKSVLFTIGHAPSNHTMNYTLPAAIDFTAFSVNNVPTINFYLRRNTNITSVVLRIKEDASEYFYNALTLPTADTFGHFSFPLGTYYKMKDSAVTWSKVLTPQWSNITEIEFYFNGGVGDTLYIDGLYIGGAPLLRIARECFHGETPVFSSYYHDDSGSEPHMGETGNPIKFKVIRDDVGKDDSLEAADDSGLMAQLALSELMRLHEQPLTAKFSTPLIADVLPGQYFYIASTDWRITKVTHKLEEHKSYFEVTTDVTNSHARLRYDDVNRSYAAIRPEWQDRQASNVKISDLDIRIAALEKYY